MSRKFEMVKKPLNFHFMTNGFGKYSHTMHFFSIDTTLPEEIGLEEGEKLIALMAITEGALRILDTMVYENGEVEHLSSDSLGEIYDRLSDVKEILAELKLEDPEIKYDYEEIEEQEEIDTLERKYSQTAAALDDGAKLCLASGAIALAKSVSGQWDGSDSAFSKEGLAAFDDFSEKIAKILGRKI